MSRLTYRLIGGGGRPYEQTDLPPEQPPMLLPYMADLTMVRMWSEFYLVGGDGEGQQLVPPPPEPPHHERCTTLMPCDTDANGGSKRQD